MQLPTAELELHEELSEFDIWVTPSLGEITDTEKFQRELARIVRVFEELGQATNNFQDIQHCHPTAIASTFAEIARPLDQEQRSELLKSLASTLFLVTGKFDNNSKCQFPLFLRDRAMWDSLPSVPRRSTSKTGEVRKRVHNRPLPRVITSDSYMDLIAAIESSDEESRLLEQFVSFLLQNEDAVRQFWSLGFSYFALKQFEGGYEKNLLSPIVIFKVRGSVTASGGHEPEQVLRVYLEEWGLMPGRDFNAQDIVVDGGDDGSKTRAYDFILPYATVNWADVWDKRLMIQSQFYAGDSGSVSHKNVDQTSTSRVRVLEKYPTTRFVEYVDGAGYFSSLNGDLRRLLSMETTRSFFQIRSAPIRLRRELQQLGFITPLEIEHAIAQTSGQRPEVEDILTQNGYQYEEIKRAIGGALDDDMIDNSGQILSIKADRREIVRQYFILDLVATNGSSVEIGRQGSSANVLIPGYGAFFGIRLEDLVKQAVGIKSMFSEDISHSPTLTNDISRLSERGFIMVR
jgi:hypothetical protein